MEILTYTRKIQAIGDSFMVSLPKHWMQQNGFRPKEKIRINLDQNGDLVIKRGQNEIEENAK